jgi:predicted O-methyltransferase YrrM
MHSNIGADEAERLRTVVRTVAPTHAIEIGMAYGISTLYILDVLASAAVPDAALISVDPFQSTQWRAAGIENVNRFGFSGLHRLIEEPDYVALPHLLIEGERFQFAYVDGDHGLDHVILDLFYLDRLLDVGGVVGLNDVQLLSVKGAIEFLVTHRHYDEVRFGWDRRYDGATLTARLVRRALNWQTQDRFFRKVDDWRPAWTDYVRLERYLKMQWRNRRRAFVNVRPDDRERHSEGSI